MSRVWQHVKGRDTEYWLYSQRRPKQSWAISTYTEAPNDYYVTSRHATDGRTKDIGPFDSFEAAAACF